MLVAPGVFDKSLPAQFAIYLGNLARGDFGVSIIERRPVTTVASRLRLLPPGVGACRELPAPAYSLKLSPV